ncbi:ribosome-recycling factor [Diatrype stigma]|uniref:Ribosome-recycling factor n=1 Tax=Diatrype stigma TaxID=117547 RepID=A0AAN9UB02_9PEZI
MKHIGSSLVTKAIARPELARISTRNARAPNLTTTTAAAAVVPGARLTAATASAPYSSLCQQCLLPRRPAFSNGSSTRPLHTTAVCLKKAKAKEQPKQKERAAAGSGSKNENGGDGDEDGGGRKHPQANPEEPSDFTDVQSRLAQHDEHFKETLKKLRSGGRFNPDVLGSLRVAVASGGGEETYPLRELAQVVPRGGRAVSILAHEASAVKPIMSAVQASPDFNQQPQRDPDNELELTLKIQPDAPEEVQRRVKAVCHDWRERVRQVRQRRDKQHAAWRKEGVWGPDLKHTVDKALEKIIKAKTAEIDAAEKDAVKSATASGNK